ncbi:DUF1345 domain-containing protein [Microbacterium sp. gxy059]|uniref:DUF1345 domain-containing protein n=1 Tax=Microbacterium sp. gxy059 TaxID=2957199 RepID=UPI003D97AFD9
MSVGAGLATWFLLSPAADGTGSLPWLTAALVGWIAFVAAHVLWVALSVGGLDAVETRRHAQREDPRRAVRDALHIVAALASVAGMGAMLLAASFDPLTRAINAGIGRAAVFGSWTLIQLTFMLRYAALFYEDEDEGESGSEPPIDFHTRDDPAYIEFAYPAFTVGTSFATSDSDVRTSRIRAAVLGHTLLSFFFGSVVLASVISLVLQLVSVG